MAVLTYFQVYKCHLSFEVIMSLFLLVSFQVVKSVIQMTKRDKQGISTKMTKGGKL